MAYFRLSSTGKALASASSQSDARQTGLGFTSAFDALVDDANNAAMLTTLGITAAAQSILDDTTVAAIRATIGAGVGFTVETKNASFTAADAKLYEIDASGGAISVTMPSCAVGAVIGFKVAVGGNNVTINRASTEDIDNQPSFVLTTAGEAIVLYANAAGNKWLVL